MLQYILSRISLGLLLFWGLLFGIASAESSNVESHIRKIDRNSLLIVLDDGKTYQTSEEFNFDGLKVGTRVTVLYTNVDGKRVINDIDVIH